MGNADLIIKHASRLLDQFNEWPSFHDAEIVKLELRRETLEMDLHVYVFKVMERLDAQGCYKRGKQCLIIFRLTGIKELNLHGFNRQNVVAGIHFTGDKDEVEIILEPNYGLSGTITCAGVEILSVDQV